MAYVKGTSGSFEFNDTNKFFTIKVNWSETYEIASNSSIVSIDKLQVKSNEYVGTWYPSLVLQINGAQVCAMSYFSPATHKVVLNSLNTYYDVVVNNGGVAAPWKSSAITHNSNGSKSISISVLANSAGDGQPTIQLYASGGELIKFGATQTSTVALTNIPRAATLTAAPNFNDEGNPTITYTNPAGTALTALDACISLAGGADIPYRAVSKTGTSYTFNLTDAERATLRNATLSGSTSRTITFYLRSTIDGTYYYSTLKKTFTVVNCNPTLSVIFYDNNSTTAALTGASNSTVVKGYSNLIYEMQATALKGASITAYSAACGSKKATTASGTLSAVDTGALSFSATDNRGLTASKSYTLNLVNYFKPTIAVDAKIEMTGETTARVELAVKGTFFNATFGAVKNTLDIQIKHTDSNDWVSMSALGFEASYNGNNYSITFGVSGLNYVNAFTYQVRVIDKLETIYSAEETLKVNPVFDWSKEDFNLNVPIYMGNNMVLRYTAAGATVLSADSGNLYLRPNGNEVDTGQLRLFTDGKATLNGVRVLTLDLAYPVGAIYLSVNSTSPASIMGGTWTQLKDRFLLGAGSTYTNGATGGAATHTLTEAQMPKHRHSITGDGTAFTSNGAISVGKSGTAYGTLPGFNKGSDYTSNGYVTFNYTGGGSAHNNMPPYLVVYIWKRTA